ncbi:MAG: hypothetical protein JWM64_1850 [Frankiales bacterium]|nr:hypothetical protein [Frankiales bacterium]
MTAAWELSAVATELLLRRPVARQRVLSLTLKELVVCGAWRLVPRQKSGFFGSRRVVALQRGDLPVPARPPLPLLHERLGLLVPGTRDLAQLGPVLAGDADLVATALASAREDLRRRGLMTLEHRRLLGDRLVRTPQGEAAVRAVLSQREAFRTALRDGGAAAVAAVEELGRSPGLVVLLDRTLLREVDRTVRGTDGWSSSDGGVSWTEVCDADTGGLDGCFDSFDSSGGFDSSSSGGDSGGGDGGGGGGD